MKRIQLIEGIPISQQRLIFGDKELNDLDFVSEMQLSDSRSLMLLIEEDPKIFRFSLDLMSFFRQHNAHPVYKDGEKINVRVFLEAESPI